MGTPGRSNDDSDSTRKDATAGQESEGPIRFNDGCPPMKGTSGKGKTTVNPKDLCAAIDGIIVWLEDIREVVCAMDEKEIKLKGKK